MSPTEKMLTLVWRFSLQGKAHSWDVLNHSMRLALRLAISSGFEMKSMDWWAIYNRFRGNYWMGVDAEWAYALAVQTNNVPAFTSYEDWAKRGPFIADDVEPGHCMDESRCWNRQRGRLAVGFSFPWDGQRIHVTSFTQDGTHLIACSYSDPDARKIKKRYRITAKDIQAARAEKKAVRV